jgi:osmotically-inducible protein OsmY
MPLAGRIELYLLTLFACQAIGCIDAQMRDDDALASKVDAALLAADELNLSRIEVNVENGRVYLSGMSDDHESKEHAELEAGKIPGVKGVINKIEVDF